MGDDSSKPGGTNIRRRSTWTGSRTVLMVIFVALCFSPYCLGKEEEHELLEALDLQVPEDAHNKYGMDFTLIPSSSYDFILHFMSEPQDGQLGDNRFEESSARNSNQEEIKSRRKALGNRRRIQRGAINGRVPNSSDQGPDQLEALDLQVPRDAHNECRLDFTLIPSSSYDFIPPFMEVAPSNSSDISQGAVGGSFPDTWDGMDVPTGLRVSFEHLRPFMSVSHDAL